MKAVSLPVRWFVFVLFSWLLCFESAASTTPAHQFVTARGITVLLVESHANPMFKASLVVRAGSAYDPPGQEGLADLTSWLLNEGAGELDGDTLKERLEFYGIQLGATADRDAITVSLTSLSEHLEEALARLADAAQRPLFSPEAVERGKEERLAQLAKDREDPETLAGRALYRKIFAGTPYAHPVAGSEESMAKLQRTDVLRHFEQGFHGPGMVLAVVGDVEEARLRPLLDRYFALVNPEPSPFQPIALLQSHEKGTEEHIEMDLPQTTVRLGRLAIHREDPDYYPLTVMNHILGGGGFSSRLTHEVREKRGLTYGIYSYFLPFTGRGPMVIGWQTKTASTQESLELVDQELARMAQEGISETELTEAKQDLIGSFPLRLDGVGKLVNHWAMIGFHHRGLDYLEKWPDRIRAVTREQVAAVARRLLNREGFDRVTVGKAQNGGEKGAK